MSPKVRLRKIPIIMYSFLLYLSPLYLSSRIFLPAEVSLSMGGCGSAYTEKAGRSPPSPRDFPLLLQEGSYKDRTFTFCIAQLFCVRSREWTRSILRTFCETSFAGRFLQDRFAGLLSPRPRFLSSRKERNQRFAKEEVSSLETPLRGTSPRELRKRSSLPLSSSAVRGCQVLHLPLRAASGYVVADSLL